MQLTRFMKSRGKLIGAWAAVAATAAFLLLWPKVSYVQTDARGALFWNANTAYVFIGLAERGYKTSYLGLAVYETRELIRSGAPNPTDKHFSVLVLQVTPGSIQRYEIQNFWLGSDPSPFEGNLYAGNMLSRGRFVKWTGTGFEPATPLEAQEYREYALKLPSGPPTGLDFDNVEGWSKRALGGDVVRKSPTDYVERDAIVTIDLAGAPLTLTMNSGFIGREAYIDLQRPGESSARVWSLDERPRRVSRAEYSRIFLGGLK
jgi:hypothetical protein